MKGKKQLILGAFLCLVVMTGIFFIWRTSSGAKITPKYGTYWNTSLNKITDSSMFHLIVLSDSNIKIETLHGMVTLDYIIERKTFGRDVIKLSGINDDNKVSTKEFDGAEFMIISHDKIQSMGKYSYIEKNEVYELMNKK